MTGLHGVHIVIGMAVLGWVYWLIHVGKCTPDYFVALENAGLYWHLVDLIWIYLFPLYYLIV
jgi:cytochrome c oxidase subunit 3